MTTTAGPAEQVGEAPRLGKVSLLVGDETLIDYVLPAGVALIAVIEDLLPRVNDILKKRGVPELDDKLTYRLCRTDATPLDVQRSLDDSGIVDGEVLWLLPADATERFAPVIEEVSTALARSARQQFPRVDVTTSRRVAGGLAVGLVAWAELMLGQLWWQRHGWVPAAVSGGLAAVLLVAARGLGRARDEQRRSTAIMLVWAALIAAGAAAALAVPGPPGGWHLVAAISTVLAGLSAVAILTGRYVGVLAALLVVGLCGGAVAAVHASGWQVTPAHLAVVFLLVCLLLVTFAPSIGVIAAGVPGPWFPSITNRGIFETPAGGQRNTVSPVARTDTGTVEQITQWARRGTAIVTGLLAGSRGGAHRRLPLRGAAPDWRWLAVFGVHVGHLRDLSAAIALVCRPLPGGHLGGGRAGGHRDGARSLCQRTRSGVGAGDIGVRRGGSGPGHCRAAGGAGHSQSANQRTG